MPQECYSYAIYECSVHRIAAGFHFVAAIVVGPRAGAGPVGAPVVVRGIGGAEPGPSRPPQRQQTPRWVAEASSEDLRHSVSVRLQPPTPHPAATSGATGHWIGWIPAPARAATARRVVWLPRRPWGPGDWSLPRDQHWGTARAPS